MREAMNRGARLLVADDNKVNRLLLSRNLELQGHSVATAENGRRGARDAAPRVASTCCCSTWKCRRWTVSRCSNELKQDLQLRDLPVIVTSSLEGIDHVVRCIELGAEDYLPKPVNPVLLKARIGASLEKKRLRDQQKELMRRFATPEVAQDLQQSGFALGGQRVARHRHVLRHPRLHAARGDAAARGDDRAPQQLLRADVRRDRQSRRRRHADGRATA